MRDLIVIGMNGMGDCIHQRAVVRQLMERHRVWLHTPWPSIYHDLVGDALQLLPPQTTLRTQTKNAQRQRALYTRRRPGYGTQTLQVSYSPEAIRRTGSVLGAMCEATKTDARRADFRLPVPASWHAAAAPWVGRMGRALGDRRILFYRPLNERSEWSGCPARNPDHETYAALVESIASRYYLLSVADIEPGKEWLVGRQPKVDASLHGGELSFEAMAALIERHVGLVYTSPGFALILAQAVGTPVVGVFGGYENAASFSAGAHYAPFLPIEPITPCDTFRHEPWDKTVDLIAAFTRIESFADETADRQSLAA